MDTNRSLDELKKLAKKNSNITYQEWNAYAHENGYLSSIVLIDRSHLEAWDQLIDKLLQRNKKELRIEIARKKADDKLQDKIIEKRDILHYALNEYGLNHEVTRKASDEIDKLINKYYSKKHDKEYPTNSDMYEEYRKSYEQLKQMSIQLQRFPSIEEWNKYAKENDYRNSECIKYISGLTWHELRSKIDLEKNLKIF